MPTFGWPPRAIGSTYVDNDGNIVFVTADAEVTADTDASVGVPPEAEHANTANVALSANVASHLVANSGFTGSLAVDANNAANTMTLTIVNGLITNIVGS